MFNDADSQRTNTADILNAFCKLLLSITAYFLILIYIVLNVFVNLAVSSKTVFKLSKHF